jgi:hypothetical protein
MEGRSDAAQLEARRSTPMHRSLTFIVLLMAAFSLTAANKTLAQGTFGSVPDPITSRDLDNMAERLALSDQQVLAISEFHTTYLQNFRTLRDGEIQRWLDDVQDIANDFDLSKRREVETAVRTLNRLMQRVRSLDEQFFDEMQNLLTEEQSRHMPRVRLARERVRYGTEMTRGMDFINPGVRVDLTEIVLGMNVSPDVMKMIDPILETYERQLTFGARKLFDTGINMILDLLKELEQRGFTTGRPDNPVIALALFEAFQEIWDELSVDLQKDAKALADLNRSTYRRLATNVPDHVLRELRTRYYRQAYPEAAAIGASAQREFDAALLLDELPDDLYDSIEAMAMTHWRNQDRIANQIADLLDERRADLSIRNMMRRSEDERQNEIDELRDRARAADESALATLHSMLGEERTNQLASVRPDRSAQPSARERFRQQAAANAMDAQQVISRVPNRISPNDLKHIVDVLELTDDQAMILESLHDSYLASYRVVTEQHLTPLRDMARELAAAGLDIRNTSAEHGESVIKLYRMQRDAFNAVREIDDAFYEDIKLTVVASDQATTVDRLRLQRERGSFYFMQPDTMGGPFATMGSESNIDITELLRESHLASSLEPTLDRALLDYEREATQLVRDRWYASMDVMQAMQVMASRREDRRAYREIMRNASATSQRTTRALESLNRSMLSTLLEALPSDAAHALQHQYRQRAFPSVFDDPRTAEPKLDAAMNLANLAQSQRDRLRDAAVNYRTAYAQIANRMFEVHESRGGENRGRNAMDHFNALERLRFERNEVNDQLRRQLRAILNDEQIKQIGGL